MCILWGHLRESAPREPIAYLFATMQQKFLVNFNPFVIVVDRRRGCRCCCWLMMIMMIILVTNERRSRTDRMKRKTSTGLGEGGWGGGRGTVVQNQNIIHVSAACYCGTYLFSEFPETSSRPTPQTHTRFGVRPLKYNKINGPRRRRRLYGCRAQCRGWTDEEGMRRRMRETERAATDLSIWPLRRRRLGLFNHLIINHLFICASPLYLRLPTHVLYRTYCCSARCSCPNFQFNPSHRHRNARYLGWRHGCSMRMEEEEERETEEDAAVELMIIGTFCLGLLQLVYGVQK